MTEKGSLKEMYEKGYIKVIPDDTDETSEKNTSMNEILEFVRKISVNSTDSQKEKILLSLRKEILD